MAHTPGPWFYYNPHGYMDGRYPYNQVLPVVRHPRVPDSICTVHGHQGLYDFPANAHLLAAAPDLLAACENALRLLEDMDAAEYIGPKLRAAIQKARGTHG